MAKTLAQSGRLSAAVAASRVLGLVRESLFAALFGGQALADAFQVAFRLPNLLRDLFAEGALSSAFVPTFTAALVKEGKEAAYRLGNLVLGIVLALVGLLVGLGLVFAEPLVVLLSDGFAGDVEKVALATTLARVMMPFLLVISVAAVFMGMLNAQKRFGAPALGPVCFNVVSIVIGVTLWAMGMPDVDALRWWSIGTVIAGCSQAGVQLPVLWKLGFRPLPRLRGALKHPGVRRIGKLMAPAVLGLAAVQVNLIVNTRFAGQLGDGPIAQLAYAFRVFYLPVGIFSVALATITTTRVSEDAARNDTKAMAASAAEAVDAVLMLMAASTVGLAILAHPVVELLFERGAFGASETTATAQVLMFYVLGLVPYGLVKIFAPIFYSLDKARVPLFASASAVAVNVTFNALTYRQLGAPGIALGMSLGALTNVVVLRVSVARTLGPLRPDAKGGRGKAVAGLVLANAVMGGAVYGLWWATQGYVLEPVQGIVGDTLGLAALVFPVIGIGFATYVLILRGFGYPGAELLASLPKKVLGKLLPKRKPPEDG